MVWKVRHYQFFVTFSPFLGKVLIPVMFLCILSDYCQQLCFTNDIINWQSCFPPALLRLYHWQRKHCYCMPANIVYKQSHLEFKSCAKHFFLWNHVTHQNIQIQIVIYVIKHWKLIMIHTFNNIIFNDGIPMSIHILICPFVIFECFNVTSMDFYTNKFGIQCYLKKSKRSCHVPNF